MYVYVLDFCVVFVLCLVCFVLSCGCMLTTLHGIGGIELTFFVLCCFFCFLLFVFLRF